MTDTAAAALALFQALDARTEARFKVVHEDARRDRREVLGHIESMRREVREGFSAVNVQLKDVCDRRLVEHGAFAAGIEALNDRLDAKEHRAQGREQVLGPVKGFIRQHGVMVACLLSAAAGGAYADDIWGLAVANSAAAASVNAVAPPSFAEPSATAAIPPEGKSLALRERF